MNSFHYCLNSSTIRPASLLEKIRIASAAGYRAIELWNDDLNTHVQAGGSLQEIKQALDDAGLQVPTVIAVHGWLGSSGQVHQRALDEARQRMEQAVAVGASHIVASPPMDPVDLSRAGEDYAELLEMGRQIGVAPSMEYLGFVESVYTIDQAWQIATDSGRADATVVMDPFHILRGGGAIESIAKIPGERVAIWHWNDIPGTKPAGEQTDADRVMPGDGVGPLREIERLARQQGYSGFVSLELFNPELWARNLEEVARIGLDKMQAYFGV